MPWTDPQAIEIKVRPLLLSTGRLKDERTTRPATDVLWIVAAKAAHGDCDDTPVIDIAAILRYQGRNASTVQRD